MSYTEDIIQEIYPENYMAPMSNSSFYLISLICLGAFLYNERERFWRYIFYSPGYGMIESRRDRKSKTHELSVETDIGKIKIPTLYHPDAQQNDIYLFQKLIIDIPDEKQFVTEKEFKQEYPLFTQHDRLEKYGNHFLLPTIHTRERENNMISGFIKSLGSDHLLVFTVKNSFIDYQDLILNYELCLKNVKQEIDLDNLSDDEFVDSDEETY